MTSLASGLVQLPLDGLSHFPGAGGIEQHAHLHAGATALGQRVRHALSEHALLPQIVLEMHRPLGRTDLFEEDIEIGAILDDLDRVPVDGSSERQPRQRRHQLVDWRIAFYVQIGIAMALDRPYDEREENDGSDDQRQQDDRHRRRSDGVQFGIRPGSLRRLGAVTGDRQRRRMRQRLVQHVDCTAACPLPPVAGCNPATTMGIMCGLISSGSRVSRTAP